MEENIIIVDDLPNHYRIIADTSDDQFYPQREMERLYHTDLWSRFATRKPLDGEGSHVDTPLRFATEEIARDFIDHDYKHPHKETWGNVIYTLEELSMFMEMRTTMVQWRTLAADFAYIVDQMVIGVNPNGYTGVISHKMAVPLAVTIQNQKDFIAKYRRMRGIKLDE